HVVMENCVTLDERSAASVLAAGADVDTLHEEGAEGNEFAHAPVDLAFARHLLPVTGELKHLLVGGESLGDGSVGVSDTLDDLLRDRRGPADDLVVADRLR